MTVKTLVYMLSLCLFIMIGGSSVQAQQSSRSLDENGIPYSSKYWESQPDNVTISLIRKPELNDDQFVLRLANSYSVNGCIELGNYAYEAEYRGNSLDISLGSMTVDMRNQPQYAHLQCLQNTKVPVADIVINRSDLMANQTKMIKLINDVDTSYYILRLTENNVMILPEENKKGAQIPRFKPQNIPGRKTALSYWFYPLGTIILWSADMNKDNEKNRAYLREFAQNKDLVPLETIFQDFTSPLTDNRYQYFVDTKGQFSHDDPALSKGKIIGTMNVEKKIYGLEKDEIGLDKITVYAKTPGMYE